jgi:membrane protease YdiL (CAAX protease family)
VYAAIAIFGGAFVLAVAGLLGLILLLASAGSRRDAEVIRPPIAWGGIYAETFAVWFALFLAVNFFAHFVNWGQWSILGTGVLDVVSLSALGWPVLRGIPWVTIRQDIGLRFRRGWQEPLWGIAAYAISLPLLAIGLAIVFGLLGLQARMHAGQPAGDEVSFGVHPAHPIVQMVGRAGWQGKLQIVLLLCVFAPFVEEIMFRGVLYTHLRAVTKKLGFAASFLVSTICVSFIFAVIHPQGPLYVPLLMALAFGFTIAREWRQTLIPGMVAHGINNGLVVTLLLIGTS